MGGHCYPIYNDDMEKWTSLPILLAEGEEIQQRVLQFIEYVDGLLVTKEEKIKYIITLSSLVKSGKLDIKETVDANLFVLVDYFKDKNISDFENELLIINNPTIMTAVRIKSLENEYRVELLNYISKLYKNKKIGNDEAKKEQFVKQVVEFIKITDYYELLEKIRK